MLPVDGESGGSAPSKKPGAGNKTRQSVQSRMSQQPSQNSRAQAPPPARAPLIPGGGGASATGQITSGGGGGGGGIAAPAAPPPMSIQDWLGQDSTYQTQHAALLKALSDYQSQMGKQQTQYEGQYQNNLRDLGINKQRSVEDQQNDFASRGLLFSGVYGQDANKLVSDFSRREGDMATQRSNWLDNLLTDFSNFKDQQTLTEEKAKQDAIARRAAQFGL